MFLRKEIVRLLACPLLAFAALPAFAASYYVDPASGSMGNNGSSTAPWSTLEAVFTAGKKFQAGDVIYLRSGYHGFPTVSGSNTGNVMIQAQSGHTPKLKKLVVNGSRWVISGLTVSPEVVGSYERGQFVDINGSYVTLEDCTVYSAQSISGWTASTWTARAGNGIRVSGPNCIIADNLVKSTNFAIQVSKSAPGTVVSGNTIDNFMGDGMRGLADNCIFEYNVVKNCFKVDTNHDDGFQSWSTGSDGSPGTGVIRNVVLRGNKFISYTDSTQPEKSTMQGIGCFGGVYENWVIENNLIVTDQWHGLSFYGAVNCRIVNNTVIENPIVGAANTPWIGIYPDQMTTRQSTGNIVRNNIASGYKITAGSATVDSNITVSASTYSSHFVNYGGFDFHLKSTSAAVNKGNTSMAPVLDIDEQTRSSPPDLGCYELVTSSGGSTVAETVATPAFSIASGTFSTAQNVGITTATSGASIRYTTDGSTPTATTGTLYSGPVPVSVTTTLKAVAFKSGMNNSAVASASYTIDAVTALIAETFSSSPAGNFSTLGGTWAVSSGKYVLTNPVAGASGQGNGNLAIHSLSVSGDFVLTVDASAPATTSAWDDFSVIFGYQSAGSYYYASFNESNDALTSGIFKVAGGVATQLADITTAIAGGSTYAVKIEKTGSTYKVYLGNVLVATTTDSTYASGKIGLGTQNNGAAFDNVTVVAAAAIAPEPIVVAEVDAPAFSIASGTFSTAQSVAITTATSGASIRYTTDGSTPTATTGILYSGPVPVNVTTTLKAVAFKSGMTDSQVSSATYTINATSAATSINESFTSSASNFTTYGGTWSVSKGTYVLTNPAVVSAGNGNLAIHATTISGNFELAVDGSAAATTSGWDDFSVIFGYQSAGNYYYASFNERNDGKTSGVFKVVDGVPTQVADITAAISGGRSYHVRIVKAGSTYKVYRSNTLLATMNDSTFSSGKVGLGSQNNGASFDNLSVVPAP